MQTPLKLYAPFMLALINLYFWLKEFTFYPCASDWSFQKLAEGVQWVHYYRLQLTFLRLWRYTKLLWLHNPVQLHEVKIYGELFEISLKKALFSLPVFHEKFHIWIGLSPSCSCTGLCNQLSIEFLFIYSSLERNEFNITWIIFCNIVLLNLNLRHI